ncbi:DUF418 domain-containing protein [Tamlana sp. I1]|uniref:DUF418 domain-containing protein n=1 Tax=Tamlana sp. I1 TaxID=2762061 RepID=UPI00188FAC43|nr:DUF418 domain-containing protein [Tamlana sp. I1]
MSTITEPNQDATSAHPVRDKNRIIELDVLRGFAVLGILLMNIKGFGILLGFQEYVDIITSRQGADFWTMTIITILFEGKMRALFCMLFGAGIILFCTQKKAFGKKNLWKLFYIRMFWLAVFGLLHAHLLLWRGDILYYYGVFGMLVFLLRNMKPKYKAIGVPVVAILGFIISVSFYQGFREKRLNYVAVKTELASNLQQPTEAQQKKIDTWMEMEKDYFPDDKRDEKRVKTMQGSYTEIAKEIRPRAFEDQTKYLVTLLGDNIALMLLGMALLQWGFFSGKWQKKDYRLTAIIGYGVGILLVSINHIRDINTEYVIEKLVHELEVTPIDWYSLIYPFQRIFIVMGHAAIVILFVKGNVLIWLKNSLKAVGQMAFTNYILQTIFCTFFFFGYGLGYYDKLAFHQLYYVVFAVWIFELIVSPLWLKYYKFGPLEWLWRSLTYRKFQSMKR